MNALRKNMSAAELNAILDYLDAELEEAQTTEDLAVIMKVAKDLLMGAPTRNAVVGLDNVRADMDASAIAHVQNEALGQDNACTMQLEVPTSLSVAFTDLSLRMRQLQARDPETFANASNALNWLANGHLTQH